MSCPREPLRPSARRVLSCLLLPVLLAACGKEAAQGGPAGGEMQVPVSVVTANPQRTEITVDLPGRVKAIQDAEIRARVTGIVKEIHFKQGGDVKAGDLLFTIDPAPYVAARDRAAAELKRAEADVRASRLMSQRYAKLVKEKAISRQEYDNAVAQASQSEAAVAAARAALQSSEIDLAYTRVESPIDGRIGQAMVTEGALVSAASATQLATVQQLDRVYVDVPQSASAVLQLRQASGGASTPAASAPARVILDDGSLYPVPGQILFTGVAVDPGTGQVNLRAEFPNPDQLLLPGLYVRVRLVQGINDQALRVPQQALQRTADGLSSLYVVRDGKAQTVAVEPGAVVNGETVITKGLSAGDTVVVEGFQKIRPGAPVMGMPWKPGGPGAAAAGAPAVPAGEPQQGGGQAAAS